MRMLEVIGGLVSDDPLENALTNAIIAVSRGYLIPEISKEEVIKRVIPDPAYSSDVPAINITLNNLLNKTIRSHDERTITVIPPEEQRAEGEEELSTEDELSFDDNEMFDLGGEEPGGEEPGGEEFGRGGLEVEFPDEVEGVDSGADMVKGAAADQARDSMLAKKKFSDEATR